MSVLEKVIETIAPGWAAERAQARTKLEMSKLAAGKLRGFNATSKGRRAGDDWTKLGDGCGATESASDLATLRVRAREMSRNNPYWVSGKRAIVGSVVGFGIRATAVSENGRTRKRMQALWDDWADSKYVDAAGKLDFYGMQALVMSTVVSDGECLVRRVSDGSSLKLQVLGPEYLSNSKDGELPNSGEIVGGVETDQYGAEVAYHLFKRHPSRGNQETVRIDARDMCHVFRVDRPNQVRGESWIAPVFTRLADWDDYEDAELMRQKVAACFGAVYTGVGPDDDSYEPLDKLEPGMIEYMPAGTDVKMITPPASTGLRDSALITHRAIAAGLGVTYESVTGDFERVNFSSARMGHLQMSRNVRDWQQHVMIDLFCDRVWKWFTESATLLRAVPGEDVAASASVTSIWTVQSRDLIDPEKETRANISRVRSGFSPWSDVVRESGRDPEQVLEQIAQDNKRFDELGLVLDVDPRKVSAQGQGTVNQKQEGSNAGTDNAAA